MQGTSDAFKLAISSPVRELRVSTLIYYDDAFTFSDLNITTTDNANISYPNQVMNSNESAIGKIASLDGSFVLDESFCLAPSFISEGEMGWWGNTLCDDYGLFSLPYPSITIYNEAMELDKIKLCGDDKRNEFPINFTITFYDKIDTILKTITVTNNTICKWSETFPKLTGIYKIVATISKWNTPNRQAKILDILDSNIEIYDDTIVESLTVKEESEYASGAIPLGTITSDEIDITFNNIDRRFDTGNPDSKLKGMLKPRRYVEVNLGVVLPDNTIEYCSMGKYWTTEWQAQENSLSASVTARDFLDLVGTIKYKATEVKTNITAKDLIVDIFTSSGILPTRYDIDTELDSFVFPYAYFNDTTVREALRLIVEAVGGLCSCDRSGKIIIQGFTKSFVTQGTVQCTINGDSTTDKSVTVKSSELVNNISVPLFAMTPSASSSAEVYLSSDEIAIASNDTMQLQLSYTGGIATDQIASLVEASAGITITEVEHFATYSKLTISSITSGTYKIKITGRLITSTETVGYTSSDDASIRANGEAVYTYPSNYLLQTKELCTYIGSNVLSVFKSPQKHINLEYTGNPALEPEDFFSGAVYRDSAFSVFKVYDQTVTYDGALTVKLIGREIL